MSPRSIFQCFQPAWAALMAVGGVVVVVVGYVLITIGIQQLGIPVPIWQGIGFLLLVIVMGVMFYQQHQKSQNLASVNGSLGTEARVYGNRTALDRALPLRDQIGGSRTIDGLWLAGRSVFELDSDLLSGIVRDIVFPHPEGAPIGRLATLSEARAETLVADIRFSDDKAKRIGASPRYLREFPGFVMMLGNADGPDGWINLELLLPNTRPENRPAIRITQQQNPDVYETLVTAFKSLKKAAEEYNFVLEANH